MHYNNIVLFKDNNLISVLTCYSISNFVKKMKWKHDYYSIIIIHVQNNTNYYFSSNPKDDILQCIELQSNEQLNRQVRVITPIYEYSPYDDKDSLNSFN